jgi:hypothetical protein
VQHENITQHLSTDKWVESADLAAALGINIRSLGQRMRALYMAGAVVRSESAPYAYRLPDGLAGPVGGDLTVIDDDAPCEPVPPASFAIWDDGSLSVHKGDSQVALDIEDVKRLITFVTRFR